MDVGKFKTIDFDDDDALPAWLRDDTSPDQPPTKAIRHTSPSQVKSTEGFTASQVKRRLRRSEVLPPKHGEQPTVSIQIHMPQLHVPRIPFARLRPWLLAAVVVFVGIFGGKMLLGATQKSAPTPKAPTIVQAELGYKPLQSVQLVAGKVTATPPKYDEAKKLYSFYDSYKGANLTVDQQAVPEKLKTSKTAVRELATSIGANDTFTTTLGAVYISSSEDANTQRMMLVSDKMLMFIQSTKTLPNTDWVVYIQSLQ
ncbi:hypothetical protein IPP75_03005 [Candidatus Saccharibacteria bacterium]|nr:MAG: hypothetical protein IPP75_03005 [Candidatus Saccharibacteria bacterium]